MAVLREAYVELAGRLGEFNGNTTTTYRSLQQTYRAIAAHADSDQLAARRLGRMLRYGCRVGRMQSTTMRVIAMPWTSPATRRLALRAAERVKTPRPLAFESDLVLGGAALRAGEPSRALAALRRARAAASETV